MPDKPQATAAEARETEPDAGQEAAELAAAERDEAQTLRQAPDNASPGEAAGGGS